MQSKTFLVNANLNTIGGELDEIDPEIMQRNVFRCLRKCGWQEVPWKRHVVLSFDIISCKYMNPNLTSKQLEQLPLFVILFGIQIVNTRKFQPIGRVFCEQSVSPATIATCIKSFIRDLMRCEYFVVATVCKPLAFFRRVVEILVEKDSPNDKVAAQVYRVDHLKVVHFYDPITMLEHTFLMFLKFSIEYRQNRKNFLATYEDCKKVMLMCEERDIINDIFNHTSNTRCAARLFSMTFYRTLQSCIVKGKLKDTGTAEFIAFFDMLFDTLHGDTNEYTLKINRSHFAKTSCHMRIWNKFLPILRSMRVILSETKNGTNTTIKHVEPQLADECEFYELLNSFPYTNPLDTEETARKLRQRIRDLQAATEKLYKEETNLKNIEVRYYDDEVNVSSQAVNNYETAQPYENEFSNEREFYVNIDNFNYDTKDVSTNMVSQGDEEDAIDYVTYKKELLEDYSKKLYIILQESEGADVKSFDDYGCETKLIEDEYVEESQTYLLYPDKALIEQYGQLAHFVIRHFGIYLDYLEYFIDETCVYKKTNCIKLLLHQGTIEYNKDDFEYSADDEYIDENQILYSNETIIGEPIDVYADLQVNSPKNNDETDLGINRMETAEKYTETKEINVLLCDDYNTKSRFNIATINSIFDAFTYIKELLKSHKNYTDIVSDIVDYLRNFNSFNLRLALNSNDLKGQTFAIYECVIKMLTILAINKATTEEQQEAYKKASSIQRQLQTFVDEDSKLKMQDVKDEGGAIHSIPSFFGNTTRVTNENIEEETEECDVHINLDQIHEMIAKTYRFKIEKPITQVQEVVAMEVDSEEDCNEPSNKVVPNSSVKESPQPFIFDAWQISVNGAKKLFEFLQKKRFTSLDMNSINIDHIKQLVENIRSDHGVTIDYNHHFNMAFINSHIMCDIFETDGAIVLK